MAHTAGERLFCRYARSPNELGYCGPSGASGMAAVARGEELELDVRAIASQFSGAWVYQAIIARMTGLDPLDERVVRGYWTGNELTAELDRDEFWRRLISVIGPRAGAYWKHLDASLAPEANPSHAFHVLGVYPWSRLLSTGRPEPVEVLSSCCIRPARVTAVDETGLTVEGPDLVLRDGRLRSEPHETSAVPVLFGEEVAVGDTIALHWGAACDRLDDAEATRLSEGLAEQLELLDRRLARESS